MEKWSFNIQLLGSLSEVLDLTGTEIARRCGLRQQVFSRYATNERGIPIQVLIKLCNVIRMPINYFVSEDDNHIIPNRENATIPIDEWHPVFWNSANVEKIFGDGSNQIRWRDVAEVMKVTPMKPHERFSLRRRFKVTDFLTTCNAFDLSPFLFLNDPNRPIDTRSMKRKSTISAKSSTTPSYSDLLHKVDALEHEIAELKQKIDDLPQCIKEMLDGFTIVNASSIEPGYSAESKEDNYPSVMEEG